MGLGPALQVCWLGIWPGGFPSVWCWRARAWGRWRTAPIGLACPHPPSVSPPPPASSAPIGLACPHGEEEGSALVLGIGFWLWQSALSFPSLSFVYKSIVFPSLWIDRQFIIFSSSPSSSRVKKVYCRGWSRVYLEARGEVYLGVELETIYLGGEAATVTCMSYSGSLFGNYHH